ncbi:MAG: amidohydrolase [Clostridia bacterium]|nr:amidohydrolase [Clostridia bacterium]
MDINEIKLKLTEIIDENSEYIKEIGRHILKNPELGYFEEKTSAFVRKEFEKLGIEYAYPCAVTGVKGSVKSKNDGPCVAIIGEMDALFCAGNKFANENNVAHACGHNAQVATMLGTAIAIAKSGVLDEFSGKIVFFAVPAEEFNELSERAKLKAEGKLEYFGGKQQLIAEGAFDDVDIAIMVHAQPEEDAKVYVNGHNLGFITKTITFKGKAAHGSKPHEGTNALNAAALGILGIHSNRETFEDHERIRIHPIITKGGDVVNSVPDEVCIDTYVRGATLSAIEKGNNATERAMRGAAQMIGASVEIEDISGYLPIKEDEELTEIFAQNAKNIVGEENVISGYEITGSTDMGDLSAIIPAIQPSIGGFTGNLHSKEFCVADEDAAYILPVKIMAHTVAELLANGAQKAIKIKDGFKARLTKEEYLDYLKGE